MPSAPIRFTHICQSHQDRSPRTATQRHDQLQQQLPEPARPVQKVLETTPQGQISAATSTEVRHHESSASNVQYGGAKEPRISPARSVSRLDNSSLAATSVQRPPLWMRRSLLRTLAPLVYTVRPSTACHTIAPTLRTFHWWPPLPSPAQAHLIAYGRLSRQHLLGSTHSRTISSCSDLQLSSMNVFDQ